MNNIKQSKPAYSYDNSVFPFYYHYNTKCVNGIPLAHNIKHEQYKKKVVNE